MPKGKRGGSYPGERRGGKKRGSKNKKTIEREIITAIDQGRRDAPAGIAKEVLAEFMMIFRGMAAKYQPMPGMAKPTTVEQKNDANEFERWAMRACHTAHWLAPYQHPTYKAVLMQGDVPNLDDVELIELSIFDDHNKLIEHIPSDRRRLPKPVAAEVEDDD